MIIKYFKTEVNTINDGVVTPKLGVDKNIVRPIIINMRIKSFIVLLAAAAILVSGISAAYSFFAGQDWVMLDQRGYSPALKTKIKILMLKSIHDASVYSGNPITYAGQKDFAQYVPEIDKFYSDKADLGMPLYFAFKLAHLKKQGLPEAQYKVYKASIEQKLNNVQSN